MKELSQREIDQILAFLDKKRVKYLDVQIELLDHVASQIEEIRMQDPKITFEAALHKVYKSFGVYGFTKVVEKKMKEQSKLWEKKMFDYIRRYFQLPRILILLTFTILLFVTLKLLDDNLRASVIQLSFLFICTSLFLRQVFISVSQHLRAKKIASKILMLKTFYTAQMTLMGILGWSVYYLYTFSTYSNWFSETTLGLCLFTFLLSLSIILIHAFQYTFKSWYQAEVDATYKKYKGVRFNLKT